MISLTTANTALRDVYLGVLANLLKEDGDIFFKKLKYSTAGVYGNLIQFLCRREDKVSTLSSKLTTMTASFAISDKAIRVSENNAGAFVNLLNDEIEDMVHETQAEMARCLYGVESTRKTDKMNFTSVKELFNKNNELYGSFGEKLIGRGKVITYKESPNNLNFNRIAHEIIGHNEHINLIICPKDFMYAYKDWMIKHNQSLEVVECGKWKGVKFDGVEMYANRYVTSVYGFNMEDFTFHELCDWRWVGGEEILKQISNMPKYGATLVKYGNLICVNPEKQIKIIYKNT